MFTKILYPTDLSDVAEKGLRYIKQLKAAGSQEVIILHVVSQRIIDGLLRHGMLERDIDGWRTKAKEVGQEAVAEMRRELEGFGFAVQTVVKTGYPADVILDMEKREAPSIIVIGSHGRTNLGDILLGSVSRRVIRKCKGPVLVVKRDPNE